MSIFNTTFYPTTPVLDHCIDRDDLDRNSATRFASHSRPAINDDIDQILPMSELHHHPPASTRVSISDGDDWQDWNIDMVPALTRSNSDASSPSDLDTDVASIIQGGFVMDSHDGILVRPTRLLPGADLLCPFQILDCETICVDTREFKIHFFSHFDGQPLPAYATCFLCGYAWFQAPHQDPSLTWNRMLDHMVHDHFRAGQEVAIFKPSMAVMRHMWNRGIITEAQLKRCQLIAEPVQLPRAVFAADDIDRPPQVPMPPHARPPLSVQAHLNQSVGSQSEVVVIMAGRRLERRQRDVESLRARVRGHS